MKANIKVGQVASVALNTLESYPTNPRRGDIEAIAQSLKAHGQYRPIVVQYGTIFDLDLLSSLVISNPSSFIYFSSTSHASTGINNNSAMSLQPFIVFAHSFKSSL